MLYHCKVVCLSAGIGVASFVGLVIIILLIILIIQMQKNRSEEQKDETIQHLLDNQMSLTSARTKSFVEKVPSLANIDSLSQAAQARAASRAQAIDSHIRRSSRSFMPTPPASHLTQPRHSLPGSPRLAVTPGRNSFVAPSTSSRHSGSVAQNNSQQLSSELSRIHSSRAPPPQQDSDFSSPRPLNQSLRQADSDYTSPPRALSHHHHNSVSRPLDSDYSPSRLINHERLHSLNTNQTKEPAHRVTSAGRQAFASTLSTRLQDAANLDRDDGIAVTLPGGRDDGSGSTVQTAEFGQQAPSRSNYGY